MTEKILVVDDLINEFFEIARYNLSDIALQYSKINFSRLLEQLAYEFEPMLREKELTLTLDAGDDIMLSCDANKLQRVFDNLLRNAVLYSFHGTEITITTELQIYTLIVKVINRGDTVPKEKLERLFEQFYRLDAARSEDELIEFTVTIPLSQENRLQEEHS